jgi:hypothetical protein
MAASFMIARSRVSPIRLAGRLVRHPADARLPGDGPGLCGWELSQAFYREDVAAGGLGVQH